MHSSLTTKMQNYKTRLTLASLHCKSRKLQARPTRPLSVLLLPPKEFKVNSKLKHATVLVCKMIFINNSGTEKIFTSGCYRQDKTRGSNFSVCG